ncbi:kynureninase [Cryptosporangium aurantiacum]|uniref:Kynureninase n=1 Tax=Cryptosporangium aurantiacum TaxID=134849 RepID=A0A1M7Q9C2_9ACTN|nr:kynureninase [Cryptosporangium aurantiacum]SHN26898.1 Kynureninase [Cryptosporangium aurantiacum]
MLTSPTILDAADPLARFQADFVRSDPDLIYLDGNSLGRLPRATADRVATAITEEWGRGLIRSWSHWIDLAREIGDRIGAGVVSARPGEVLVGDSTTVNLYKLAAAALDARPDRRVIVLDDDNFPTDLYVLQGLAAARNLELRVLHTDIDAGIDVDALRAALDDDVALLCLSHVAYRSGALADMSTITEAAHAVGALVLWDLSHAAGSVPVPLTESGADLAVGCTYKYLNGGPGAPAFLYVRRELQATLRQPIWGWFGQQDQFAMGSTYQPVAGIERFAVGTPPVLGLYAVEEGIRPVVEAGIDAIRAKGVALTSYAVDLSDAWLTPLGFRLASPRDAARRGGHVSLYHPDGWRICQALIARDVVPDYRTPDRLRLGFSPLTTSFEDVWTGLSRLRDLVAAEEHLTFDATPGRVT